MPVLSVSDRVVGEGDRFLDMVVKLDAASTQTITVNFATADYTTRAGQFNDYFGLSGTLTFLPGETSKVVRIDLIDDSSTVETLERFTFGLSAPQNATLAGEGYAWVQIVDNDTVRNTPGIFVRDTIVDEQAGVARFVVSLGRVLGEASASTVTVDYATADGTAVAGSDYAAQTGRLTFAPGESVKTVEVPILNDGLAEGRERFSLVLSNASSASIADAQATAEIAANDAVAAAQPGIVVRDSVVGEGDGFVDIEVQLTAPSIDTVSVAYRTADYTTRAGQFNDYYGLSGTLTFLPGETSKVVRIDLIDDSSTVETLERFTFGLSAPQNATLAGEGYAWVQIVDNDTVRNTPGIFVRDTIVDEQAGVARFVVSLGRVLGEASASTVTVDYATADGTAVAGSDYAAQTGRLTFAPGESVKTVEVPILNDGLAEGRERFSLVLSNASSASIADAQATAEIAANDAAAAAQPGIVVRDSVVGEGDGFVDIEVQLTAPSIDTVSVAYRTADYTTRAGQFNDYYGLSGTLTFLPGETSKVVRIDLIDDSSTVETLERFTFGLSAPQNATLAGEGYAWVQIVDNDTVRNTPGIFVRDTIVDEQAGVARFVVSLGRVLGEASASTVTVDYATADGTAVAGSDYAAQTGRLTFAPGESVKTVEVPILNDGLAEGRERFSLVLSNASSASIADAQATAEIAANDAAAAAQPGIVVRDSVVGEGDGFVDIEVQLTAPSIDTVSVAYRTADYTTRAGQFNDYYGLSGTLTFLPGETSKVVRIDLIDDSSTNAETLERFTFGLSAPRNATLAGEGYAWVQIVDNDTVRNTPGIFVRDTIVDEQAGVARFVVSLGRVLGEASLGTVAVDYRTENLTATAGSDYIAQSGRLVFAPGESVKTVTVHLVDDRWTEAEESFQLRLSNPGNAVITDGLARAIVIDSDVAPRPAPNIVGIGSTVAEGDGVANFIVLLDAPGSEPVTFRYETRNGSAGSNDFTSLSGTAIFAPGEIVKTIAVELLAGTTAEPQETFTLQLSAAENGVIVTPSVTATIVDDDNASIAVSSGGISNDVYVVTSQQTVLVEDAFGGIDTVVARLNYTLPAHIENLSLAAGAATAGTGNELDNLMRGNAANNRLDGMAGTDTVFFAGPSTAYTQAGNSALRTVSSASEGTDTLVSIERLWFTDVILASDTQPADNAFLAYATFNAAFDRSPSAQELGQWTSSLDQFDNAVELAQTMISHYAPGVGNEALVAHLWSTIVETPITATDLAAFVGLIENGTYSQASLLAFVATHPLNTVEITGIVGQTLSLDPAWFVVPAW